MRRAMGGVAILVALLAVLGCGDPAPPATNYGALRARLLAPLGPLIVAVRENSPTVTAHAAAFDAAAAEVLPALAGDTSVNANRLHSTIAGVREAVARRDVAALERERAALLQVR